MRLPGAGTVFEGKYEIIEPLGSGGFATVLRARDVEIGRDVAIKVLAPEADGYERRVVARFMVEARVIAGLQDAHTIRLFEFGESDDGLLYMVFQYVAGRDLSEVLKSDGQLAPETAVHVARQMLSALAEAHRCDVLHRDIKPGNVLIHEYMGDPFTVKLLDFGIAKVDQAAGGAGLTKTGTLLGTPRYMAPEQVFGESLGPTTDLYGVGLVLFEMLTGRPAMEGSNKEVLRKHAQERQHTVPPDVAWPALTAVVEKMLAHEPHQRYQSAREASDALAAALEDRSTDAAYVSGAQRYLSSGAMVTQPPRTDEYLGAARQRGSSAAHPQHSSSSQLAFDSSVSHDAHDASASGVSNRASGTWRETGARPEPTADRRPLVGAVIVASLAVAAFAMWSTTTEPPPPPPATRAQLPDELLTSTPEPPTADQPALADEDDVGATAVDAGSDGAVAIDVGSPVRSGCGREHPPTNEERWINPPQSERGARVYLPNDYDPNHRHALVLGFGPKYESVGGFAGDSGLKHLGYRNPDVIVLSVAPTNRFDPWEDPADFDTTRRVLDGARELFCIDEQRIFAVGHHDGGRFVRELACQMPLSGIAMSGFAEKRGNVYCELHPPVPALWVVGRKDEFIPLEGGHGCTTGPFHPAEVYDEIWRRRYLCGGEEPQVLSKTEDYECKVWDCEAAYASCRAKGGHHLAQTDWALLFPKCSSSTLKFDLAGEAWRFFKRFGKPIAPNDPRNRR